MIVRERHGGGAVGVLLVFTVAFGLAAPRPARANDPALAEQLYEVGRKLMAEGRASEACPRFAESERLDPATGTLLNLAACHEAEGKLATAWAEFREAQTAARHDGREDRERFAAEHIAALEPRLSYLRVIVDAAMPADAVEVMLDESLLGSASWGVAAPIDPGPHQVTARAPGRAPFRERIVVTTAPCKLDVKVVLTPAGAGVAEQKEAAPVVPVVPFVPVVPLEANDAPADAARPESRVAGYVALGAGAVAVAVGIGFGLDARSKWKLRNSAGDCDHDVCSQVGVNYGGEAQTAATVADVAFALGAVALGTAGYLLFIRPETRARATSSARLRVAPSVARAEGALTLTGAW